MYIVGAADDGKGSWLNGISWNPAAEENIMEKVSDKVYQIKFENLPEEMGYEFKCAANGNWNANWGVSEGTEVVLNTPFAASFNAGNIKFDLDEDSDVTVTLDLTGFNYASKEGAKITIDVTPAIEETTAPVVETTAPVEETTVPVEETTVPAVETTAPVVETTAPVVEPTTVPAPSGYLTVTGTSNYFPQTVQSFTKDELAAKDNLVTVYFCPLLHYSLLPAA